MQQMQLYNFSGRHIWQHTAQWRKAKQIWFFDSLYFGIGITLNHQHPTPGICDSSSSFTEKDTCYGVDLKYAFYVIIISDLQLFCFTARGE